MFNRRPQRGRRASSALQVESLEERMLLAVEPLTLTNPSFWGESAMGVSRNPSISADGQRVAFESQGLNVVPNDFNSGENNDVFVYDRGTGLSTLVSVNAAGTASGNAESIEPQLSPDGRYVVFLSDATDLVAGATILAGGGNLDVFVRDLQRNQTFLISSNADGTTGGNNGSTQATLVNTASGGVRVVFTSSASNLVANDTNNRNDIFVRDLQSDGVLLATRRISVSGTGTQGDGNSFNASATPGGRFVVFQSQADNLVPNDTSNLEDIYVYDVQNSTIDLITVDSAGVNQINGHTQLAPQNAISDDGRFVVFWSSATNIGDLPVPGGSVAYLRDRNADTTRVLSRNRALTQGVEGFNVVITGSGQFAGFVGGSNDTASDITDTNNRADVFLADLRELDDITYRLVSVNSAGTNGGNDHSGTGDDLSFTFPRGYPAISPDGTRVAFGSTATDLVAGVTDANNTRIENFGAFRRDLFVRDLSQNRTQLVSVSLSGDRTGDSGSFLPRFSADGRSLAFVSFAADLVGGDANVTQDVFLRDLTGGNTDLVSRRSDLLPVEQFAFNGGDVAAVSPDGRHVAFTSFDNSGQIVPGISILGGHRNLFVRDTLTGVVRVASVLPNGTQTSGGNIFNASLSADGRIVAFNSNKSTLDASITGTGIYVRDLVTGITTYLSRNQSSGAAADSFNGDNAVVVSPDGRWVAFTSRATNLISGVTVPTLQFNLYVYDRDNNALRLVSLSTSGTASGDGSTPVTDYQPTFSADSRRLVYVSRSSNLVAGVTDSNNAADVFAYDLTTLQNQLVSVSTTAGTTGNADSGGGDNGLFAPSVSADGRYVAFASTATNLTAENTNSRRQVFVRDLTDGTTRLVSFNQGNSAGGNGHSVLPQISADGTTVLFQSLATNIGPSAGNSFAQLYVRSLSDNTTQRVSVGTGGGPANQTSGAQTFTQVDHAVLSPNGRYVAFNSRATDLVPNFVSGGAGALWNLYVRDLHTGLTALASPAHTGTTGANDEASVLSSSGFLSLTDAGKVVYSSAAGNLVNGDRNNTSDVFAYTFRGAGVIGGTVFRDDDGDGTQNGGEPALPFQTVYLDANNNQRFDSGEINVQSDSSGNYAFTGLGAGTHTVRLDIQPRLTLTVPLAPDSYTVTLATDAEVVAGRHFGIQPAVPDLVVSSIVATPNAVALSRQIEVTWTVHNTNRSDAPNDWQDAVYLSADTVLDESDALVALVPHTGGLVGNGSYNGRVVFAPPALPPGDYYVLVQADRRRQVVEETDRSDNLVHSAAPVTLTVPTLTLDEPFADVFTGSGQNHYYQIATAPGQTLQLTLDSAAGSGGVEIYLRRGQLPTPWEFDDAARSARPDQRLTVPTTQPATYFVLVRSRFGAAANAGYTLTARLPGFAIDGVSPSQGGNNGRVTVAIEGSRFSDATQAQLVRGGTVLTATSVVVADAARLLATFDLSGLPLGSFDVRLTDGATTVTLPAAFEVVPGAPEHLDVQVFGPEAVRAGLTYVFYLEIANRGNTNVPAPLLTVFSPTNTPVGLTPVTIGRDDNKTLLAGPLDESAPVELGPGESRRYPVYFIAPPLGQAYDFRLRYTPASETTPLDFAYVEEHYVIETLRQRADWSSLRTALQQRLGPTWGSFVAVLNRNAALLPAVAASPLDPIAALTLEVDRLIAASTTSVGGTVGTTDPAVRLDGRTVFARNTTTGVIFSDMVLRDGSFAIGEMSPGQYELTVDGLLNAAPVVVELADGQHLRGVEMMLAQGSVLFGTVRLSGTGTPIEGALIRAAGPDGRSLTAVSSADGSYRLEGLSVGLHEVIVDAAGRQRTVRNDVVVSAGIQGLALELTAEAGVRGSVSLEAGGPTGGMLGVLVLPASGTTLERASFVETWGQQFVVGGLTAGTYDVEVRLEGYIPHRVENVVVPVDGVIDLGELNLLRAGTIRGTVVSADPLAPAEFAVVGAFDGSELVAVAITDGLGGFTFRALRPATYTLRLAAATPLADSPTVVLALGQEVADVVLTVADGASITGRVVGGTGAAVSGATVLLYDAAGVALRRHTDAEGRFLFDGLPVGAYTVSLPVAGPATSQTVTLTDPAEVVALPDLTLASAARVHGSLLRADGMPATDGAVSLMQGGAPIATVLTGADGTFAFLLTQPGTFDLVGFARDASFAPITGLTVSAGTEVRQDFVAGTGNIEVTVTNGGQPVAGAVVLLQQELAAGHAFAGQLTSDGAGVVRFDHLAAGTYRVEVLASGNRAANADNVVLSAGGSVELPLTLQVRATLSGAVLGPNGLAVAGAQVELQSAVTNERGPLETAALDGSYRMEYVPAGTYDIVVRAAGFQTTVLTNVVVSGDTPLDVALAAATSGLAGRVVDGSGRAVPDAAVAVFDSAGLTLAAATTGADGSFSVSGVAGTGLRVRIEASGYAGMDVTAVAIAADQTLDLGNRTLQAVASTQTTPPADEPTSFQAANRGDPGEQPSFNAPNVPVQDGQFPAHQLQDRRDFGGRLKNSLKQLNNDLRYANEVESRIRKADGPLAERLGQLPPPPSMDCPDPHCKQLYDRLVDAFYEQERQAEILKAAQTALDDVNHNMRLIFGGELATVTVLFAPLAATPPGIFGIIYGGAFALSSVLFGVQAVQSAADASDIQSKNASLVDLVNNALLGTNSGLLSAIKDPLAASVSAGLGAVSSLISALKSLLTLQSPFQKTADAAAKVGEGERRMSVALQNFNQLRKQVLDLYRAYERCLESARYRGEDCDCKDNCTPPPPLPYTPLPPPPGPNGGGANGTGQGAFDPNEIVGFAGFGQERFVAETALLPYTIRFENDPELATAPALEVVITHQLDANLDWSTFELGNVGWGAMIVEVPNGVQSYQTRVEYTNVLSNNSPLFVDIAASLDPQTGVVRWEFRSLDPTTGQLPLGITDGFLPPEDQSGIGQGFVDFTIRPQAGLATGTTIEQRAFIVFDTNDPVETVPAFVNTIDQEAPTSSVTALPTVTGASAFVLSWQGDNDGNGSGLAGYDVYVSTDGGAYVPLLVDTLLTSTVFRGKAGHTYAFYAVAEDNVGNRGAVPELAQATTRMEAANTATKLSAPASRTAGAAVTLTATVKRLAGGQGIVAGSVTFVEGSTILGTAPLTKVGGVLKATLNTGALGFGKHVIEAIYNGNGGLTTSTSAIRSVQILSFTNTEVVSSAPTALRGSTVTFTATVTASALGASVPVGTVSFFDVFNGVKVLLRTVNVDPLTGTATLDTSALKKGTHKISAKYTPTTGADFLTSKSTTITQVIQTAALRLANLEQPEKAASTDLLDAVFARWR